MKTTTPSFRPLVAGLQQHYSWVFHICIIGCDGVWMTPTQGKKKYKVIFIIIIIAY
jgi:hypothetical protein